jgi:putative membrane protein
MMDHSGSGDWWILMWVGMALMWALIIAGVWLVVAAARGRNDPETAEDILAQRFARGDIGRDEYRALLDELQGLPRSGAEHLPHAR